MSLKYIGVCVCVCVCKCVSMCGVHTLNNNANKIPSPVGLVDVKSFQIIDSFTQQDSRNLCLVSRQEHAIHALGKQPQTRRRSSLSANLFRSRARLCLYVFMRWFDDMVTHMKYHTAHLLDGSPHRMDVGEIIKQNSSTIDKMHRMQSTSLTE